MSAPHRATRLVLINTCGLRASSAAVKVLAWLVLRRSVLAHVLEKAGRPILKQVFHSTNVYTEKFTADSLNRPRDPVLGEMSKVFEDLSQDILEPRIALGASKLTMPVLLIWGDGDKLVPLERIRQVVHLLPRGELEVITGCGHMPIIEHPERTVALIERFLTTERVRAVLRSQKIVA